VNGNVVAQCRDTMSHLDHAPASSPESSAEDARPLLRIQEVAATLGLTTRSIRYYEEIGLLEPAARSEGAYRLFDADDVERLRFIKGLRDDAGFSLAEIGQLLEDEAARTRNRARFRTTRDARERRAIVDDALDRVSRQIESLRAKQERLTAMIAEAEGRREHLLAHVAELESGMEPAPHDHAPATASRAAATRPSRARDR
jgi:DNA-binding transcriptional MerR regulator